MSAFKQLQDAQCNDSTWKASIKVMKHRNIATNDIASSSGNPLPIKSHSDLDYIDIVPYLEKPSVQTDCMYQHELNYPPGASFCFHGYNGIADANPLSKYIIKCALASSGTALCVGKSHGPQKKSKR